MSVNQLETVTQALSGKYIFSLPYIANHSRRKSYAVVEMNSNSLENNHGFLVVLCDQIILHRGIIAISLEGYMGSKL